MTLEFSCWKQVETLEDCRIGRKARVRLGVDESSRRTGVISEDNLKSDNFFKKRGVHVDLDNNQGRVYLTKQMFHSLQVWYDLQEEKKINQQKEDQKLIDYRPTVNRRIEAASEQNNNAVGDDEAF